MEQNALINFHDLKQFISISNPIRYSWLDTINIFSIFYVRSALEN